MSSMSAIKRIITGALALMLVSMPVSLAAPRYNTKEAELTDFTIKNTYGGAVIYQVSRSTSLHVPGAIMGDTLIEAGQTVAAGDVIATYTAPMNEVDIARAEIALSQAQDDYEYEIERRTMVIDEYRAAAAAATDPADARIYELYAQREELELDKYRAEGEAYLASLTAQRDAAVTSADVKNVTAPIGGTVAYVRKNDPGTAATGREIAGFFDPSTIIIRLDNTAGTLKYGMKVELALDGSGRKVITGTVVSCDNVLPGALRTGYAYVLPDEYPGDQGFNRVEASAITVTVPGVVVVPNSTLQYSNGQCYVKVLDEDGTVNTRYVSLAMTGANESWVFYGVEPGDKLIAK